MNVLGSEGEIKLEKNDKNEKVELKLETNEFQKVFSKIFEELYMTIIENHHYELFI